VLLHLKSPQRRRPLSIQFRRIDIDPLPPCLPAISQTPYLTNRERKLT
jgi:hypothetical protein